MSKIYSNPSIADLLQGIKDEDAGITAKVYIRDLPKVSAPTIGLSPEYTAMQMATAQVGMYYNMIRD